MGFLTESELKEMGFKSLGKNVKISSKSSIYNAANISIGDHSRIDDFCVLSTGEGGIVIGANVHIACFCSLIGKASITMRDFSGLSSRVAIYSSSDDYSGKYLTNPTVDDQYKNVIDKAVVLEKHVIVGSGSVILPGVSIGEGSAIGAMAVVTKKCEPWGIFVGNPARFFKSRSQGLLALEEEYINSLKK